jgi:hypothetical protein
VPPGEVDNRVEREHSDEPLDTSRVALCAVDDPSDDASGGRHKVSAFVEAGVSRKSEACRRVSGIEEHDGAPPPGTKFRVTTGAPEARFRQEDRGKTLLSKSGSRRPDSWT